MKCRNKPHGEKAGKGLSNIIQIKIKLNKKDQEVLSEVTSPVFMQKSAFFDRLVLTTKWRYGTLKKMFHINEKK